MIRVLKNAINFHLVKYFSIRNAGILYKVSKNALMKGVNINRENRILGANSRPEILDSIKKE